MARARILFLALFALSIIGCDEVQHRYTKSLSFLGPKIDLEKLGGPFDLRDASRKEDGDPGRLKGSVRIRPSKVPFSDQYKFDLRFGDSMDQAAPSGDLLEATVTTVYGAFLIAKGHYKMSQKISAFQIGPKSFVELKSARGYELYEIQRAPRGLLLIPYVYSKEIATETARLSRDEDNYIRRSGAVTPIYSTTFDNSQYYNTSFLVPSDKAMILVPVGTEYPEYTDRFDSIAEMPKCEAALNLASQW